MMKRFLTLLAVLSTGVLFGQPTESRTWTAKSGHKVEAKALAVAEGKVRFERADGTQVTVEIAKLSDDDQELLREHFEVETPDPEAAPEVEAADDLPHPLGETTGEISTGGEWSYFLYLPKSLAKGEKHPVMFIMNPGGGGAGTTNRYIPGAERNRMILAVSKQSKNGFEKSQEAVDAMIEHVLDTLPIDGDRLYTSGFSGGSRMALATATKNSDITGVLACGAGGSVGNAKQVVYGLCGTNCFNRTDMAHGFKGYRNRDGLLRYFPGKHAWAGDELIDDGITHLNGVFLLSNGKNYPEATERYVQDVMALVRESKDTAPMRAFMWTSFLTEHGAEADGLEELHRELGADEVNETYVKGLQEIEAFAEKSFGEVSASQWKADPKVSSACLREAKKYPGTPWEEVLTKMAEDAQKF
ncbi:poly(3-hydroxybutyrate)depolymerase [Haloferula helveola]|uniref:Poly(3-hydroxybutyrate)depolymerase n=1 Tax=Haloferula helveola TaxID=490095 RepID=A0ABM7RD06_9BACT|nr:poly(3-hydroxybutyrate)depolymerase [Haloferula helveola]